MELPGMFSGFTLFQAVVMILLLVAATSSVVFLGLLVMYRSRFHEFRDKCLALGPELKLTQGRLDETTTRLEDSNRKLDETLYRRQSLLDEAAAGIFLMDRMGEFTYANSTLSALTGMTAKQVLREGLIQAVHPDDRERVRAEWAALRDGTGPQTTCFRFLRADGSTAAVCCQMHSVKASDRNTAEYAGIIADVSGFDTKQQALQTESRQIRSFIDRTAGGFYHLVPDEPVPVGMPPEKLAECLFRSLSLAACNDAFASLYGRPAAELTGLRLNALPGGCGPFAGPESLVPFIKAGFQFADTETARKDQNGNHRSLQNSVIGTVEDGCLTGIRGTQRDISRQKRAAEALERRTEFLNKLLNALPGPVTVKDPMCRFLYVNAAMAERTGIPVEEWTGKTVFELLPATPRDFNRSSIEVMKSGKPNRTVSTCETARGTGWMETFEVPLTGSEGLVEGALSLSLDVSDRVTEELALQKSEEQFRSIAEGCRDGMFLADAASGRLLYANPAMCDLTGYTMPELMDMRIADIHPPGARQQIGSEFADRARQGRPFEETLPCLRKNRSMVYVEVRPSTVWINGGERIIGVYTDATERRKADVLRQEQNDYQLTVFRQSPALFAVLNPDGTIRTVNDALMEKTGRTEDQLKGIPYADLLTDESGRQRLKGMISGTGGTAEAGCEYRLSGQDGEEIAVEGRIRPIFDKADRLTAVTVVAFDITRRRRLEDQMQQCCDRLQAQLEQRTAELARSETGRQEETERSLRQAAQELDDLSHRHAEELDREILRREEVEEKLRQSREELRRVNEQLNASIERRTQALKDEIVMRKKREERLLQNESDLNQYRKELEASLQLRLQELEKQVAERTAAEEDLRQMRRELKTLSGSQKELLEEQTRELKAQIAEAKKTEERLRGQESELQHRQRELQAQMELRTQDLDNESAGRRKTEEDLKRLQAELQQMKEQQETLIARETVALNAEIAEYRKAEEALRRNESVLRARAAQLEAAVEERTRELETVREAKEQAERSAARHEVELAQAGREAEERAAGKAREYQTRLEAVLQEEQLLRRSEKQYRSLFENAADAFVILDTENGEITRANPAAGRLFGGVSSDRLLGQSLDALSPEEQPGGVSSLRLALKHIQTACEKQADAFEWLYRRTDGTPFWGLTSLTAMEEDGRHPVLAVIRDISAIKENETELLQAKAVAEQISRVNSRFVDDMQETLNVSLNPVAEISAAIMNASNLSDAQREQLAGIHRGSTELLDMMNNRLELARMAAGAAEADAASFDLHEFISVINAGFNEQARRKSLFFAMSHAHNVPRRITSDRHKLRKVLNTLLDYAIDRTDKGRVGVHATRESAGEHGQKISFDLVYTARNVNDALLARVFGEPDRLQQGDISGMELRLAISRRYAHMLGGDISVETRPGNISLIRFSITVPVENDGEPAGDALQPIPAQNPAAAEPRVPRRVPQADRAQPAFSRDESSPWG